MWCDVFLSSSKFLKYEVKYLKIIIFDVYFLHADTVFHSNTSESDNLYKNSGFEFFHENFLRVFLSDVFEKIEHHKKDIRESPFWSNVELSGLWFQHFDLLLISMDKKHIQNSHYHGDFYVLKGFRILRYKYVRWIHQNPIILVILLRLRYIYISLYLSKIYFILVYISDIETGFWPTHSLTEKFLNTYRDRIEILRNLQHSFSNAKSRDAFLVKIFKMKESLFIFKIYLCLFIRWRPRANREWLRKSQYLQLYFPGTISWKISKWSVRALFLKNLWPHAEHLKFALSKWRSRWVEIKRVSPTAAPHWQK